MSVINVHIVSPGAPDLTVSATKLYLPGYLGQTGILERHREYMTLVNEGVLFYIDNEGMNHYIYLREGFLEVHDDKTILITDGYQKGEDINFMQVKNKLVELEKKIKGLAAGEGDYTQLDTWLDEQRRLGYLEQAARLSQKVEK